MLKRNISSLVGLENRGALKTGLKSKSKNYWLQWCPLSQLFLHITYSLFRQFDGVIKLTIFVWAIEKYGNFKTSRFFASVESFYSILVKNCKIGSLIVSWILAVKKEPFVACVSIVHLYIISLHLIVFFTLNQLL